ncbi:MAG: hypothetical protein OER95_17685, partial [Acidimicrobiia bacterium]|nr:hypothetical protein [Acidimicrobiia bacterium]
MASSATNAPVKNKRPKRASPAGPRTAANDGARDQGDHKDRTDSAVESDVDVERAGSDDVVQSDVDGEQAGLGTVVVDVEPLVGPEPGRRALPPPPSPGDAIRTTGWSESLMTKAALRIRNPQTPRSLRRNRIGGVAPFVPPQRRLGRWLQVRELGRRGYVPLSPGRRKLRHRILPRTVIGISTMLLMLGVGSAFSGAAFYAYYDNRLAANEQAVSRFVEGFDQQFTDATGAIDQLRVETITEIRDELRPLGDYVADADGVINLPQSAGPSVWLLETRDEDGQIVTGSA